MNPSHPAATDDRRQWNGASAYPETLACFVTPGHDFAGEILKRAEQAAASAAGAFCGPRERALAIYEEIARLGIAPEQSAASLDSDGQTVRLAGAVKSEGKASSLDLALLCCSCLERAGMNPLLIICEDRALAACMLEDLTFAGCVQDDASLLDAGNILLLPPQGESLSGFLFFLDIKRCRADSILPVGSTAPPEPEPEPVSKTQMWERKLLDLSLRNTLLNFRVTKNCIQLLVNSLPALENALASGEDFQILHRPADMKTEPPSGKIHPPPRASSRFSELIASDLSGRRVRTYLEEDGLQSALSGLYRAARNGMEESGANTLYLALGFLKWHDSAEKPRRAPLVMLPVEIVRKSARCGYVFRLRDEEPRFNVTLLEMLRANYGMTAAGLDPLPETNGATDLALVFETVRRLVRQRPGWEVEPVAFVGIFSFTRFIMWNDLRCRLDDLSQNKIVSGLISGKMSWKSDVKFPEPEALDDYVPPIDMAVPLRADSTQLAAIFAAGKGHSFVLHGPPGTGKSQTITNIIANALYRGKSVLFVAEKMAALSVVERRLAAAGLGDFCLELHSNKARKRDVLARLDRTLNSGRFKPVSDLARQSEELFAVRHELGACVRELHRQHRCGFSLYQAIEQVEAHKNSPDGIHFSPAQIAALTPEIHSRWLDLTRALAAAHSLAGGEEGHPLREYRNPGFAQNDRDELDELLSSFTRALTCLESSAAAVASALGCRCPKTRAALAAMTDLAEMLLTAPRLPASLVEYAELPRVLHRISAACRNGLTRDSLRERICQEFDEGFLTFDAQSALFRWKRAETRWALPKAAEKSRVIKQMLPYAKDKSAFDKTAVPDYLNLVLDHRRSDAAMREHAPLLSALFGEDFSPEGCDWQRLETMARMTHGLQALLHLAVSGAQYPAAAASAAQMLAHAPDSMGAFYGAFEGLSLDFSSAVALENALAARFCADFTVWHRLDDWPRQMLEKAERWRGALPGLRDYCGYLSVRQELAAEGLHSVYQSLESGKIPAAALESSFEKSIGKACARTIIDSSSSLSTFRGALFEQRIEKLRGLSNRYEALTRQELAARISANLPLFSEGVSGSSEIGILQRAIKSGGRMMPLRKLFELTPGLLRKLCPCMLMSPLSVAQYLDPKHPPFDLVVFDEASQIPTSAAVGAIARGSELVVVGDPKQLPPTSFFTAQAQEEDNFELEDLESVLDDCLALAMPQQHLRWHYRSRHESLISFSNRMFYENKLRTFPSPDEGGQSVRLVYVEGVYDRGKTRQNHEEARAVVAEIVSRLEGGRSIGVVTFSVAQQNLIEDLLEQALSQRPDLDERAYGGDEPVFVKNLENVQGDERDVILFSIGYGVGKDGRVSLNFGPLGREGGWRRLNVAVTRARREMVVFSSLRPEQIDLNRTRSQGVAGLKAFLEFAQGGGQIAAAPQRPADRIVSAVARAIGDLGYRVRTRVGASAFTVDIGVIDPRDPARFALGILIDSENYRRAGTVLDRNHTQTDILEGLGWRLFRLWTLDWWDNPESQIKRLQAAIETALAAPEPVKPDVQEEQMPCRFERLAPSESALKPYAPARLEPATQHYGDADYFTSPDSTRQLKRQIDAVLAAESPVCREILCKRVLEAWGIPRMSPRLSRRFDELFTAAVLRQTSVGGTVFFWSAAMHPLRLDDFRVPGTEQETRRGMDQIAPEEIACAVRHILSLQIGLSREDLAREVTRVFGFSRFSEQMEPFVEAGLYVAQVRGWAVLEGEKVSQPRE